MNYGGGSLGGSYSGGSYSAKGHRTAGGSSSGSHETHESVLDTRAKLADIEQKAKTLYDQIEDSTEAVSADIQAHVDDAYASLDELADLLNEDS